MGHDMFARVKTSRSIVARSICAFIWSLKSSLRFRVPVYIYRRRDGLFINRRPDAIFVSPEVHAASLPEISQRIEDEWLTQGGLESGDTVLDVGAGIGDEALVFSRAVGVGGRVIAVEAHPCTFECLKETMELNALSNVTAVNVAISNVVGTLAMQSGESYLTGKLVGDQGGDVLVDTVTIPILLDRLGVQVVDFMKMNIEGAELSALRGCQGSFERIRRLVVSCHDFIADSNPSEEGMRTYHQVVALLSENGYRVIAGRQDPRPWVRYYVYACRE